MWQRSSMQLITSKMEYSMSVGQPTCTKEPAGVLPAGPAAADVLLNVYTQLVLLSLAKGPAEQGLCQDACHSGSLHCQEERSALLTSGVCATAGMHRKQDAEVPLPQIGAAEELSAAAAPQGLQPLGNRRCERKGLAHSAAGASDKPPGPAGWVSGLRILCTGILV